MTAELSKFAGTIAKLKYEHDAPDLNAKISLYEPSAKQSDKFLIKMEIRRLAQPVNRVLDLRNYLKKGCEGIERAGINHYLDPMALSDFDQEYAKYKNKYCLGVFEYVLERAKNRDQSNHTQGSLPDPKFVSLTKVHQRRDIRIYYSSEVHLFLTGSNEGDNKSAGKPDIIGKTTDLSERGLSIKLNDPTLQLPHSLMVRFAGLEQEFLLTDTLLVRYNLLRQLAKDGSAYAILTLDEEQEEAILKATSELLKICIHNQKRRNRVPVDNTVDSIESKIREQFVMGRLLALPILIKNATTDPEPLVYLRSEENAPLSAFFQGQEQSSLLPALFKHPLIKEHAVSNNTPGHYFVLRFRDKNKRLCFAVIPISEAMHNAGIKTLLSRAFEHGGVRIINLYTAPIDPLSGALVPTSLPDSVGEVFENLNRDLHPALKARLSDVSHLSVIKDVTDSAHDLLIKNQLSQDTAQSNEPLNLRKYLLDVNIHNASLLSCEVETNEARNEDRFVLKMPLRVIGRKRENKDKAFSAFSTNVSTRGLHAVVDGVHPFKEGNDLFVDMRLAVGDFNQVIRGQRYRVVKVQGPELWLAVTGDLTTHEARITLRKTLYEYLDKVKVVGSNDPIYGLSRAVRNIYASYHPTLLGLVHKDQHGVLARALIRSENHLPIRFTPMLAEPIGLKLLVKNDVFRQAVEKLFQSLNNEHSSGCLHLCVVARKKRQSSEVSLVVKSMDAEDESQNGQFIFNSLKSFGEPVVLRVSLSVKAKVFDKYFRDEMRYLLRYAKIKHKQCIEMQETATSILEIEDMTPVIKHCLE